MPKKKSAVAVARISPEGKESSFGPCSAREAGTHILYVLLDNVGVSLAVANAAAGDVMRAQRGVAVTAHGYTFTVTTA